MVKRVVLYSANYASRASPTQFGSGLGHLRSSTDPT